VGELTQKAATVITIYWRQDNHNLNAATEPSTLHAQDRYLSCRPKQQQQQSSYSIGERVQAVHYRMQFTLLLINQ